MARAKVEASPQGSPPSDTTTPPSTTPSSETASVKDGILDEKKLQIGGSTLYDVDASGPLAPRKDESKSTGSGLLQIFGLKKREKIFDSSAIATQESVFDTQLASHYLPHPQWENNAAFDPSFRWTFKDEQTATRKIDLKIFSWVVVMFLALNVCRYNLPSATADNLLADLGLTQADYNLGNTLFRVGFLIAELPSQIIAKKLGVDIWLPICAVCYSILTAAQFWMHNRASFFAFRLLIAFFQGGFIPDAILYLGYFYTKHQLPIRLAIFWCANTVASILNGFFAVGLLEMRGVLGYAGWQWMFLIEGLVCICIGIASFWLMKAGPSQTQSKVHPKGFFNDKDTKVIVNRVIRDDHTKATMHNREALTPKLFLAALGDYDLWPLYFVGLLFGIAGYPLANYFQLSMRQLGFNRLMANLLSIPNSFLTIFNLILLTAASEYFDNRWFICSIENIWFFPFFLSFITLPTVGPWQYFALATGALGYPYAHAAQVAWISRNSGSVRTRTISAAVYNMFVQASGIIGANLYQASDAPRYFTANKAILGVVCFNIFVLYPSVRLYYKKRNESKERRWSAMDHEQKNHYLATTSDEGAKRLDFRFVY